MVNFVVQCMMEYLQHAVVSEISTQHKGASEGDVFDMGILHDGVNVTVCVDVSITVDTTGCGLSTHIISSVN